MIVFQGDSADSVWKQAADALRREDVITQTSRSGPTRELLAVALVIDDPLQRWVLNREPAISVAFAIAEVVGILNGRRDAGYLNFYNPALPRFAGDSGQYHGAYGYRIRRHFEIDQLKRAADTLCRNPHSRQVVLQIWDAPLDAPLEDGSPRAADIPCNVCAMLKYRDGRLHWTQILRSNDLFRGVPYNFVQFTSLQEILSGWIGSDLGKYTHVADSLHLYRNDEVNLARYASLQVPKNSDQIAFPEHESILWWRFLNTRMDELIKPDLSENTIFELGASGECPSAIRNLCLLLAADSARRRGYYDVALQLGNACTNGLLRLLWERWWKRKQPLNALAKQ